MVAKLQDLWYAKRMGLCDDGEFIKWVVSVIGDKEYDKVKETTDEQRLVSGYSILPQKGYEG